jgi:hypothetical protein
MWADPAYRERFGDLDATKTVRSLNLSKKNASETAESPLEIGEP